MIEPATLIAYATVVVAIPLNWIVTVMLWRVARGSPGVSILHERAVVALAVASLTTVFGLIFLNNDFKVPPLLPDVTKIITRLTVLIASIVPAIYWLWLYRGGSD